MFYIGGCYFEKKFNIDDVVEAAPVHLFCGLWGTIATGLFSFKSGVFYGVPGSGTFFGYQILGIVVMFAWSSFFSITFFMIMKKLNYLRIQKEVEIIGLDVAELGGLTEEVYSKIKIEYGRNLIYSPNAS